MSLKSRVASAAGVFAIMLSFIAGARAAMPDADAAEVQSLLKSEPQKLMILDVRTPGEWAGGIIKGATLIQMRDIPASLARIPRDKKIIVVCATGARSGAVAGFLAKEGYPWVKNYAGGMVDWQRRGLPLARP